MNYTEELKKLLALEYNCRAADVGAKNILTLPDNRGRKYSEDGAFFSMASFGQTALITADERLHPFLRGYVNVKESHRLFEAGTLALLDVELSKYGYRLNAHGAHHMFLPKYQTEPPRKFPVKRLEYADFKRFYGDPRFPNVLCEKYLPERPDVLTLAAMDGERIMGMAGASRDFKGTPNWLQIGVDVLPEYQGRGAGKFLVSELAKIIMKNGDIPFYGTSPANVISQNTAIGCGFRPAWVEISAERREK